MRAAVSTLVLLLAVGGTPATAGAVAASCNVFVALNYVTAPVFAVPGDTVRVQLTLSTDGITGVANPTATINRVRFDLDCNVDMALGVGCTNDGDIIHYTNDTTITTTCAGVTWTSAVNGTNSNQIIFTPTPAITLAANDSVGCQLEFNVTVANIPSNDSTPGRAEEVAGYLSSTTDAQCNNGLSSSGSQSAAIPLCQVCNDNNQCTTDTCNTQMGVCSVGGASCTSDADCTAGTCNSVCTFTPSVTCDDNNACTTEACNSATGACDTSSTTVCNDNNACTTEACNTATGACDTSSTTVCNDLNPCTTEVCNTATGACDTTGSTTCNDNNSCTTEACNTATGACDTTSTVTCNGCQRCDSTSGECIGAVACDDNNACTTEACNTATGQCETSGTKTCTDENACTTESCNTATGACETTSTVTCADGTNPCVTEICNTTTGVCESTGGTGSASFVVRTKGRFGSRSQIGGLFAACEAGGMIQIGRGSFVSDGNPLIGDFVNLGNGASAFSVQTNHLHLGLGALVRDGQSPFAPPFRVPCCPFPAEEIVCNPSNPRSVGVFGTGTIQPSDSPLGAVLVRNHGTLTFAGPGTFTLCGFAAARGTTIIVTGAGQSTINIQGNFRLGDSSTLGPAPGTPLPIINVAGTVVRIGARATIKASLSAPNAEFSTGRQATLQGSFCANTSRSDKGVIIVCPPGGTTTTTTETTTTTTVTETTTTTTLG